MKSTSLTIFLFTFNFLFAQQKGASPLSPSPSLSVPHFVTRAVVIGISDYQDPAIPDLRFADKDAEAFANFLRSPAGGSLDSDHLKVLLNPQATLGQFAAALDWLIDESSEGDQVIIYFSGHGDVERKTISQPGYMLCWDAPSRVYMGGGCFNVRDLQEVVSTLSTQNKARVLMVADACRSGKLSGSAIGGPQLTSQNLAQQFANEIKILSCQPDEYSIEGEQWGGGRGAFSYHLVDGLYGLADKNNDQLVNLLEIRSYLENHVTKEVAPQSQLPVTYGNGREELATVYPDLLAQVQKSKAGQMPTFSPTENRGIEEEVLSTVDTTIQELYFAFKKALKDKVFLCTPEGSANHAFVPADKCADAYYERLITEPKLERLHNSMKRNYAAALQDDAQQVINKWMKADLGEFVQSKKTQTEKYQPYVSYLDRAAELLGEHHYMYNALKARRYFFEGYLLALSNRNPNKEIAEKSLAIFREALKWQPDLPLVYWQMSLVHGYNLRDMDSSDYYVQKILLLSPSWLMPYFDAGLMIFFTTNDVALFRSNVEKITKIDSNSVVGWEYWGVYYLMTGQYVKAEEFFYKLTLVESFESVGWNDLGWLYNITGRFAESEEVLKKAISLDSTQYMPWFLLAWGYSATKRYAEAEQAYKKSLSMDSTIHQTYNNLGAIYLEINRYQEAEQAFHKALQFDSTAAYIYNNLGRLYHRLGDYTKSELALEKAFQKDSTFYVALYNIACYRSLRGQVDTAFLFLEQALKKGYKSYGWMHQDTDMIPLRERKEQWENLMLKYFPDIVYYNLACELSLQNQIDKAYDYFELSLQNGYKDFDWMHKDTDLALLREQKERWQTLMKKYFPEQHKD